MGIHITTNAVHDADNAYVHYHLKYYRFSNLHYVLTNKIEFVLNTYGTILRTILIFSIVLTKEE